MKKRNQHNKVFKMSPKEFKEYCEAYRNGTQKWNDYDVFKKRIHKPYGTKMKTGYGGEDYLYAYRYEYIDCVVNKSKERKNNKISPNDLHD